MADHTLMRASRLLEEWARKVACEAMVNSTDPDKGVQLYAITLQALASQAHLRSVEYKRDYQVLEAAGSQPEGEGDG